MLDNKECIYDTINETEFELPVLEPPNNEAITNLNSTASFVTFSTFSSTTSFVPAETDTQPLPPPTTELGSSCTPQPTDNSNLSLPVPITPFISRYDSLVSWMKIMSGI